MEVLIRMIEEQSDFEDALRVEIEYSEIGNTKEGKQLLKWIRRRRKAVDKFVKVFGG